MVLRYSVIERTNPLAPNMDGCVIIFFYLFAFGFLFIVLEIPILILVGLIYPNDLVDEFGAIDNFLTSLWWNFLITISLLLFANKYKKWNSQKRSISEDILDAD